MTRVITTTTPDGEAPLDQDNSVSTSHRTYITLHNRGGILVSCIGGSTDTYLFRSAEILDSKYANINVSRLVEIVHNTATTVVVYYRSLMRAQTLLISVVHLFIQDS